MKVFPVSTVELAKRFTRLTTTDVRANEATTAETVRTVSDLKPFRDCFHFSSKCNHQTVKNITIRHFSILPTSLRVSQQQLQAGQTVTCSDLFLAPNVLSSLNSFQTKGYSDQ